MRHPAKATAFAALLTLAAAPVFAGFHYKSTTHMENTQARGPLNDMQVEGWADGGKSRVEFRESSNPILKRGSYLIAKDSGKTVFLVNPEDKTYMAWDVESMLGGMGNMMNGVGALLKIEISDPKVEKISEEDGGTLLGYPTRHVRYRTSYSMTMKVLGRGNTNDVVIDQDLWMAPKLLDPALGVWLRTPRTGNEQIDKLIKAEMGKIQGIPLKTISVNTSTDKKRGSTQVTKTTTEVTQIDPAAKVPASSFEIPAGYRETQLMPMQDGRGGHG
jgi:hypothetical protein